MGTNLDHFSHKLDNLVWCSAVYGCTTYKLNSYDIQNEADLFSTKKIFNALTDQWQLLNKQTIFQSFTMSQAQINATVTYISIQNNFQHSFCIFIKNSDGTKAIGDYLHFILPIGEWLYKRSYKCADILWWLWRRLGSHCIANTISVRSSLLLRFSVFCSPLFTVMVILA